MFSEQEAVKRPGGSFQFSPLHHPPPHSHSLYLCSVVGRKARALYACKAEHDSELSFIAGSIFENGESGSEPAVGVVGGGVKDVGRCFSRSKSLLSEEKG